MTPRLTVFLDVVSPFAYMAWYMTKVRVRITQQWLAPARACACSTTAAIRVCKPVACFPVAAGMDHQHGPPVAKLWH